MIEGGARMIEGGAGVIGRCGNDCGSMLPLPFRERAGVRGLCSPHKTPLPLPAQLHGDRMRYRLPRLICPFAFNAQIQQRTQCPSAPQPIACRARVPQHQPAIGGQQPPPVRQRQPVTHIDFDVRRPLACCPGRRGAARHRGCIPPQLLYPAALPSPTGATSRYAPSPPTPGSSRTFTLAPQSSNALAS